MHSLIAFAPLRCSLQSQNGFLQQTDVLPSALSRRRPASKRCLRNRRAVRMDIVPDDAALDMLSFALSGPGVFASAAFLGGLGTLLLSFAEVGPRKRAPTDTPTILLRVTADAALRVELASGGVRALREGESVLRFASREECTAAAQQLEATAARQGCSLEYVVYRAGPSSISELARFPAKGNANGGRRKSADFVDGASEKDIALFEYERAGSGSDVDREWAKVVDALSPIQFVDSKSTCKLCAGAGSKRCARCGGASRPGGTFVCECDSGRVECEWCKGSGRAV